MPVTVTKLDAPSNVVATLQNGGELLPNTTYYVVVTAKNFAGGSHYYPPINGELISEASEEISFTTSDIQKSAVITWTRPTGSTYYNVYMSKVSGYYDDTASGYNTNSGHRCGRIGNTTTDEVRDTQGGTNTHTITLEGTLNTAYVNDTIGWGTVYDANNPDMILGLIPKGNGTINVSWTGTYYGMKSICDELTTLGYGDYFYYNNSNLFILRGSLNIPSTQTVRGELNVGNHTLIFFNGTMQVRNSNSSINLGYLSNNRTYGGCTVAASLIDLTNMRAYNTIFDPKILPIYAYSINEAGRRVWSGTVGDTIKNCMFCDYVSYPNTLVKGQYIIAPNTSYLFSAPFMEDNYIEGVYIFCGTSLATYRNCTINLAGNTSYMMRMGSRSTYFYDCTFTGYWSNYLTLQYYFDNVADTGKIRHYYSISLNVVDINGECIEGANIILKDKDENIVLSTTTDTSGNITKVDILSAAAEHISGQPAGWTEAVTQRYNYSPFTLTVSKEGYDDYVLEFTHNKKLDIQVSLNQTTPTIYYQTGLNGTITDNTLTGTLTRRTITGSVAQ